MEGRAPARRPSLQQWRPRRRRDGRGDADRRRYPRRWDGGQGGSRAADRLLARHAARQLPARRQRLPQSVQQHDHAGCATRHRRRRAGAAGDLAAPHRRHRRPLRHRAGGCQPHGGLGGVVADHRRTRDVDRRLRRAAPHAGHQRDGLRARDRGSGGDNRQSVRGARGPGAERQGPGRSHLPRSDDAGCAVEAAGRHQPVLYAANLRQGDRSGR